MTDKIALVLAELQTVFGTDNPNGEEELLRLLSDGEKVVCVGAGRVGLAMAAFAKRLRHLGKDAFWFDDVTLPRLGAGDVMIIGSGSGETESIATLARIAKREGLSLALITRSPKSSIREISDVTVELPALNFSPMSSVGSAQPMTTLFEQSCGLYLDAIVLELMELWGQTNASMAERHNAIE